MAAWDNAQDGDVNVFGDGTGGFAYEPRGFEVDGWCPDFLYWQVYCEQLGGHPVQQPSFGFELIEYKPSRPTDAYINETQVRFGCLFDRFTKGNLLHFAYSCSYRLYYGSVWETERGEIDFAPDKNRIVHHKGDGGDWLINFEDAVKETRFDLTAKQ